LSALAAGAVGGGEGASYGAAQYQYNYLDHADNDALNAAKAACKGGDDTACAEKARLEAKDRLQQDAMIACRPSGYQAEGCGAVFASVIAALSSYSGTASSWFISADQYRADLADLRSSAGLDQIWKIIAPEGVNSLTAQQQEDAAKPILVLAGDPTGVTALPSLIAKANNGDPLALVQVLTFFAKFRTGNAIDDLLEGGKSATGIPNDWRPINGAGAQVNTPAGFTSYITPDGDIVHVSPAGLVYGSDKNFVNRIDHVLAHTQPDLRT